MSNNRLNIVIDTNVLLVSISEYSKYHWLFKAILEKRFDVYLTNEILSEYEEIIGKYFNGDVARSVIRTLVELENVKATVVYFKFDVIKADVDDNKFVDCAFASNAHFLVSNDKHFEILKQTFFPKVNVLKLEEFKMILEEEN